MTGGQGAVGSNPAIPTNLYRSKRPGHKPGRCLLGPLRAHKLARSASGLPRQFIAMCENNRCSILFHLLVPGGKMTDHDGGARAGGDLLQFPVRRGNRAVRTFTRHADNVEQQPFPPETDQISQLKAHARPRHMPIALRGFLASKDGLLS